ncbi:Fatty acid synthase [Cyphomyrmex costatus]|uniref:Fatty acid synthase n=1 Tax=Cyphomyrmex costatus TaxID=456900 RepID=A0A151K1H1_9HYME|nr:Fatty acid synthase [Cyphomyrmex costatus]KYN50208.1 Fatty acid synthase [Cyphomyrmex costatus]
MLQIKVFQIHAQSCLREYISLEHEDIPRRMGIINKVEKFDADFFGLSFEQTHLLPPEMRLLLESTYEAIIDAGINPKQLRGKNTAVIIGTSIIAAQTDLLYTETEVKKRLYYKCKHINTLKFFMYLCMYTRTHT